MRHLAEHLDDVIAVATKRKWGPLQLIEHTCEVEEADRARRSQEGRLRRSKIGRFKPLCDFDWTWPGKIDRKAVEEIATLGFLEDAGNVVLVAPQGLGKTMIAQNLAHAAVVAGHTSRFITASDLLLDLSGQDSARGLEQRLRYWSSIKLLVIDEIGYLSYDNRNADLLFQIVSRRYERRSIVLTTNLAFKDWPTIFPNAACTTALIDRIVHHATIIQIEGKSYRLREAGRSKRDSKQT